MSKFIFIVLCVLLSLACAGFYYAGRDGSGQILCWSSLEPEHPPSFCEDLVADDDSSRSVVFNNDPPQLMDILAVLYPDGKAWEEKTWWRGAALTFLFNLAEYDILLPRRVLNFGRDKGISFLWPDTNSYVAFYEPVNSFTDGSPVSMSCGPYKGAPDTVQLFNHFVSMTEHCMSVVAGRKIDIVWD